MIKKVTCSVSCLAAGLLLAACATSPSQPEAAMQSVETLPEVQADRGYTVTGSRIRQQMTADGKRVPHTSSPVVIYSRDEIEATGHRDMDIVLMMLHPAFF